ncbi:DUF4376 domain-containing protein [Martelella endophytica]|uniref:DUF4376 domain-containing protein n=1 Tax=Martelella endophytica TaxID=1486262 RepID=A0A0D5LQJ2_MAREN|nr:DUF4376 domain-containing protein [Martelella endophytica]AJY46474.1 hypothetical protein TM49_13560 [Martelella endophytica]
MNIFHYAPETGELVSGSVARLDPLEPHRFLIPAYATDLEPPTAADGEVAVFAEGAWSLRPDHRGQTWFDDEANPVEIDFIGAPAVRGLVAEKPFIPPTKAELSAYAARKSWETRIEGPLINGVRIKCDGEAIGLINGMAALAERDADRTFSFDAHGDGTAVLSLTAVEAIAIAERVGEFVQWTFDRRADVYAAIDAGTVSNQAEVDAAFAGMDEE